MKTSMENIVFNIYKVLTRVIYANRFVPVCRTYFCSQNLKKIWHIFVASVYVKAFIYAKYLPPNSRI
jgi:hypothetical protein